MSWEGSAGGAPEDGCAVAGLVALPAAVVSAMAMGAGSVADGREGADMVATEMM